MPTANFQWIQHKESSPVSAPYKDVANDATEGPLKTFRRSKTSDLL